MNQTHRVIVAIAMNREARRASNFLDYEIRVLMLECRELLRGNYV